MSCKLPRNVMISIPDDEHILAMFSTTLENEGYEVLCAHERQKEINQFQGKNPGLIITDDNGRVLMFCRLRGIGEKHPRMNQASRAGMNPAPTKAFDTSR